MTLLKSTDRERSEVLAYKLEELREQGVPCPFCGQSMEWQLSDKGRQDILAAVSQKDGVHERLLECDKEDCPSTEMNIPFLRRLVCNEEYKLIMEIPDPAEMPKSLLAELQSLRAAQSAFAEQLGINDKSARAAAESSAQQLKNLQKSIQEKAAEVLRLQGELRAAQNGHPKNVVSAAEHRELAARHALQQVCKNTGGAIEWPPPANGEITPEFARALGQYIMAMRADADLLRTFVHTMGIKQADLPDVAQKMNDLQITAGFLTNVLEKLGMTELQLLGEASRIESARLKKQKSARVRAKLGISVRTVMRSLAKGIGFGRYLKPEGDKETDGPAGQS